MRIAVVTPIPTPYRDPFWNVVAAQPEVELDVYYCAGGKSDRPWNTSWESQFNAEVLGGVNLASRLGADASCYWNRGIISRLQNGRYDAVIVGGYNHVTMLAAMVWARSTRTPYFLMSEVYLAQPRSRWRRVVKAPLVRWVVRHAAGCFPTGTLATGYLEYYGGDPKKMWRIPNVPDVESLWRQAQASGVDRGVRRAARGLDAAPVVLFVGRLIGLKQVELLLRSFQKVVQNKPATLLVLGDGPLREKLQAVSADLDLKDRARFLGFRAPQELPEWYSIADLFVLPSSDETWSVVVLESLASGVPVIVTDRVGCYADVVNDPVVGEVVPAMDEAALATAMARRLSDLPTREEVGQRWAPVREQLRYSVLARRLVDAIRQTCGGDA